MGRKKVTFQDIANYTGFTKTTISRYFNHPETVTVEHRQKILQALQDLGYQSNKIARILAKGETEFIGLIIPNLYLSYYAEILEQFLKTYEKHGYKFIVFSGNRNAETERQYIRELMAYNVEGLIVLSHTLPSEELASYGLPVVTVEREDRRVCSINTDNRSGGREAAKLLMRSGCERFFHINKEGQDARVPAYGRQEGFIEVCRENGKPCEIWNYPPEDDYRDLARSIDQIAEKLRNICPGERKGIFCSNDEIARMIQDSLLRLYGELIDEYRLVGFDGSKVSELAAIPISTVRQQMEEIVDAAIELLKRQIRAGREGRPFEPEHRMIPPVLVERETTRVQN